MRGPEVNYFNKGVIAWRVDKDVLAFSIFVDGKPVAKDIVTDRFDFSSYPVGTRIAIEARYADGAGRTKLILTEDGAEMQPITEYTLDGEILKWEPVAGAVGYKVTDLDFNCYTVSSPHYIMTYRNVLYGVYPVMPRGGAVKSARVCPVDIPYLDGRGTKDDPYLIATPFDFRAIDYYELKATKRNYYKIVCDIDFNTVCAPEDGSNTFTLRKPFMGELDGGKHALCNISVNYYGGFWALFEFVGAGGAVHDIVFDNVEIETRVVDSEHPTNPAIAVLAYQNFGSVRGVTVKSSKLRALGGGIAGLVVHNSGSITECAISRCAFNESGTAALGGAAYEMGGIALELRAGGEITKCSARSLTVTGNGENIGSSGGIVAVVRDGGAVTGNSFDGVSVKNLKSGKECAGVAAYCASGGVVEIGGGELGTLLIGGVPVECELGDKKCGFVGKLYGKKD